MTWASLLWQYARVPLQPPLELQVVEVERLLAGGGDVDDPRRRGSPQQVEQAQREEEVREVVDGEEQLESVGTLSAGRVARPDPSPALLHNTSRRPSCASTSSASRRTSSSDARSAR